MTLDRFQVNLGGLVEVLSQHLYSGPQVYLRELVQNAADAVAARQLEDPDAPATVRLEPWVDEPGLTVTDTGIGMTYAQAEELLATIGQSSKRDAVFGEGRQEFVGQFGIGLLAAFLISDTIEVCSRAVGHPAIRWEGHSDGTFRLAELGGDEQPVGTQVRLRASQYMEDWVATDTVVRLAAEYCSFLPVDIAVKVPVGAGRQWRRITEPELPWLAAYASPAERERALRAYCERTFGFTPLAAIDLEVGVTGTTGVAFVLPHAVSPKSGRHRVYTKRMLVDATADAVLPEWAFFVRAVLNSDALSPVASREQLRDDATLALTRDELGEQLKRWAQDTLVGTHERARRFLEVHHLALRSMALVDDDMLELAAEVLPYETTLGAMTLKQLAAEAGVVRYCPTTEAYRAVAPVARAQQLGVVNAGYVYDADLLNRLAARPGWKVEVLSSKSMHQTFTPVGPVREAETLLAIERMTEVLGADDCEITLREFAPADVPAVLLRDPEAERRLERRREQAEAEGGWRALLGSFDQGDEPIVARTLVLNDANPTVRTLLAAHDSPELPAAFRTIYYSAVLLTGEGLTAGEAASLSASLGVLLTAALTDPKEGTHDGHEN
ncbi:HSP90 family protein [Corynebacterium sp. CNCTC7651]|uniref:HSP90 family protein n=1 Tax=Corynebacterium sp. CNCTC7651 TaxID=2815361 RepID=UPI001F442F64|nr:HSP90 family protein [Corynebacterium sp. CNCTC7651]UIZ92353.1 HSP90 family protein [Corynebacterium sp. CNCTC7651]